MDGVGAFVIDRNCNSCENCVPLCPTDSIFLGYGQYTIDSDTCVGCCVCAVICPVNAIRSFNSIEVAKAMAEKEAHLASRGC